MGLAASQARFLAITARKMNCEFQSMQIAQEKLSTTRDLQRAANEYQNALNATKLVWDSDDNTYNLTYDVMMRPTTLNNFTPYMLTDTKGKVVLSNEMFKAAMEAGIIDKDGNPTFANQYMYIDKDGSEKIRENTALKPFMGADNASGDGSRNAFLNALANYNQIDGTMLKEIKKLGASGYTTSGIGGAIYDKSLANVLNPQEYRTYMKKVTDEDGNLAYGINDALTNVFTAGNAGKNIIDSLKGGHFCIMRGGEALSDSELKSITVGDILMGNYQIAYSGNDGQTKMQSFMQEIAKIFGYDEVSGIKGLNVDAESNEALNLAWKYTQKQLSTENITHVSGSSTALSKANEQNNLIHTTVADSSGTNQEYYVMNLSNLTASFLTQFARALDGLQASYMVDTKSTKKSNYVTNDPSYSFIIKNEGAMIDEINLNTDFYNMLYNVISTTGACTDETIRNMVNDEQMLQEAVKNGRLFVSYLNDDGYFYQGAYSLTDRIAEVTDVDAIARAEREYEVTKSRLNTKEETLELKMKNLDMEISSLTTEFDTVKNMISKGVEKVFTMFST